MTVSPNLHSLHPLHSSRSLDSRSATPGCRVCGCSEVRLDQVQDGAARLELGECPRCEHRWTRLLGSARAFARTKRHASGELAVSFAA